MLKTNLRTKLIVAVMLIMGVTAFMSCEKETTKLPSQNNTSTTLKLKKNIISENDMETLINNIQRSVSIYNKLDKEGINNLQRFENGDITEEQFFNTLPSEMQEDCINLTEDLKNNFNTLEKKYTLNQVNLEKSISQNNITKISKIVNLKLEYCKAKDCKKEYEIASAENVASFIADVNICLKLIEVPEVAAGCIIIAGAHYYYNQNNTANAYHDCMKNQN